MTVPPRPAAAPELPAYGRGSLCEVLPSAAAVLGVPGYENVLELPAATRVCVLLLDGLGADLLTRAAAAYAPLLGPLAARSPTITVSFPTTTATSLASLGTGVPPGVHGMLGYQLAVPGAGYLLNALRWDARIDPREWQPQPTVLEAVVRHGHEAYHVAPGSFRESGLTLAALRGPRYVPAETAGDLVAGIASAAAGSPGSLTLGYHADLDKTGHLRGGTSAAWKHQLAIADRLVEQVIRVLPEDALLVVTGDHGMVDVPLRGRCDADVHPDLRTGVALLGGEARTRYVYTEPGAAPDVLDTWRAVLGGQAWVVGRDEAIEAGWFGPRVADAMRARIGDVVAACATPTAAVVASHTAPGEATMVGMHGSLTAAELRVPLVLASGTGGRAVS